MTVSELYSSTLATLVATRKTMLTPAWQTAMDSQSSDAKALAAMELIQIQMGITSLSNAVLSELVTQMKAHEAALVQATADLNKALLDITKVQAIIGDAGVLVGVVAKILPLLP